MHEPLQGIFLNKIEIPEYVLIIASSARMLAQAAKKSGVKSLVIDVFADGDTQQYAQSYRQVASLSEQDITPAVEYFITHYGVTSVVYGSGFEYYPDSLSYLARRLVVFGNSIDVFLRLQDKLRFFLSLDELSIPYPEVCFEPPNVLDKWLIKPFQGQGGLGIQRYTSRTQTHVDVYWQKFQEGTLHSVLFLATGKEVQLVGFNRQWVISLNESQAFIFSGVINNADLLNEQKNLITRWLEKLVIKFGLKGLGSLDFIQAGDDFFVLEINPRPSASMQVYNADLFSRHIKACQGELTDGYIKKGYSGYQIVYATEDVTIPEGFQWPDGAMDLPDAGVTCRTGQPICSIIAHQMQADLVMNELQTKKINLLKGFNIHGI